MIDNNWVTIIWLKNLDTAFSNRWGDKVADSVGCGLFDCDEETVLCLQDVPVDNFTNSWIQNGPNSAQAVIDGKFSSNPFLPSTPYEIIKSGHYNYNVSILLGCNRYWKLSIHIYNIKIT